MRKGTFGPVRIWLLAAISALQASAGAGVGAAAIASAAGSGAEDLAAKVVQASGGEVWPRVKAVKFTFNVAQGDQPAFSARHHWDLTRGTDTVEWHGKTVTVDLRQPPKTGDGFEAFKRWTNDSYWLLAPLKLRDAGVNLADKGTQEIDGRTYRLLELSFANVGLTPGDRYVLYIDPATSLVARWDYMPNPEKKISATWEGYRSFNGLMLATEHQMDGRRIFFTEVSVEMGR